MMGKSTRVSKLEVSEAERPCFGDDVWALLMYNAVDWKRVVLVPQRVEVRERSAELVESDRTTFVDMIECNIYGSCLPVYGYRSRSYQLRVIVRLRGKRDQRRRCFSVRFEMTSQEVTDGSADDKVKCKLEKLSRNCMNIQPAKRKAIRNTSGKPASIHKEYHKYHEFH